MNLDRRSGAPSTFTWLLGLALGGTCAAMLAACSASGTQGGGWNGQSGGGPLGGSTDNESTGNDASTPTTDAAVLAEGSANGDAATPSGDANVPDAPSDASGDAATDAAGDGGATPDFTLIDTAITGVIDGSPVPNFDPIPENTTINLAHVGSALSIRANTVPSLVGSVAFALDATYTHTENTAPYMLCSDDGAGDIVSCASILIIGKHTLTATPYTAANLGGDAGVPITLDFTIVDVADGGGGEGGGEGGNKDAAAD